MIASQSKGDNTDDLHLPPYGKALLSQSSFAFSEEVSALSVG